MGSSNAIIRILKEEYGIESKKDLDKAIRSLNKIDLTPFVRHINKSKKSGVCK